MIGVTTHSRTRTLRHSVPMVVAGRLIERQLRKTPGCERYANVIAGPREFWTLTIWSDPAALRRSMRDGAHGKVMWRQPGWLDCYWGMRWRPGDTTSGEWEGRPWAWPDRRAGSTAPPRRAVPATMPTWMQGALGETARLEQREVAGAAGVTYRLRVPPWAIPAARRDLRVLRRAALAHPDTFRASLGIGTDGALYLLVVARSAEPVRRLRSDPEHIRIVRRWRRRLWWSTWEPEGEFGQWESRKLRDGRLSGAPPLVDEALPVRPEIAKQAREILRERLGALDDGSLVLVELLTSELVGNSYRHAGLSAADDIRLRAAAGDGWVRVEVIDRGKRFEPHVPVEKPSTDQSGWGLYMVNRTADRWGVVDRPNDRLFWFELRLRTAH